MAVSTAADFEIHVSGWLGAPPSSEARPLLPEAAQLDPASIQCFYGEEDEETACKAPVFARSEIIRTEGGHHFDGDYQSLARKILDSARRRMRTLDDPS